MNYFLKSQQNFIKKKERELLFIPRSRSEALSADICYLET